ncbi:MAG: hypothetical protein SPH96_04725 [Agathobacter sp.]|nr:hypothetical protein [Agathobacter sp.]
MGGFLLWFIILCVIIGSRVSRENKKNQNRNLNRPPQPQMAQQQRMPQQPQMARQQQRMPQQPQMARQQQSMPQQKMPEWLKNSGVYRPGTDTVRKAQPDIVVRAKINNDHFNEDDTLAEIEKMHGHKESEPPIRIEHEAVCMTHAADADAAFPQKSIFGSAQDLIVKGYDGNMDFDRDFIAEAMEMINNCSY